MSDALQQHPLEAMTGKPEDDHTEQQLSEAATRARRTAAAHLDRIVLDSRLLSTLRQFQREHLGDYSRLMRYFGATHQYDPRHPSAHDYALYFELQWSDEPVDFSAEETPAGCYTIQVQVLDDSSGMDSIAFPSVFLRCTRAEWEGDSTALTRTLHLAYDYAMHGRKRTTQAYRHPWDIQTLYDIQML